MVGASSIGLVQAIPLVQARTGQMTTIVGGLAVLAHLRSAHRATTDVDLVDDHQAGAQTQLDVLIASGAQPNGVVGAYIPTDSGPIRVDVLDVTDTDLARLPDDPTDRLHVLAHHWAAAETDLVHLHAWDGKTLRAEATSLVAGPGPLVATKLQSAMNRGYGKKATDLLDIIQLTFDAAAGDLVDRQLRAADPTLAADALRHATLWFDTQAPETLRTINAIPAGASTSLDDVTTTGRILTAALSAVARRDTR